MQIQTLVIVFKFALLNICMCILLENVLVPVLQLFFWVYQVKNVQMYVRAIILLIHSLNLALKLALIIFLLTFLKVNVFKYVHLNYIKIQPLNNALLIALLIYCLLILLYQLLNNAFKLVLMDFLLIL